jgi:hypothetical protein
MSPILGICLAVIAAMAWLLVCNERTYMDRMRLIRLRKSVNGPAWWVLAQQMDLVDYKEHLWAYFWLRDPWAQYGLMTRDLVAGRPLEPVE